jgi:Tol biopolymer transport system component
VTHDRGYDATPSWSPDGPRIVYTGGTEDEDYIEIVDVATGKVNRLTTGGNEAQPAW